MVELDKAQQLTTQMRNMREHMRFVWGEKYPVKIGAWQQTIAKTAERMHLKPLQAAIRLAKIAEDDAYAVIAVMAAYVESIDPSTEAVPQGAAA
ncbi:hypothetical protein AB7849_09535 [Rhodanobacter sp. 115]|uniref:hypothetical protein n=1 Tax=Rhodanobacter sp. FW021-MT20 TaxID=1162282 RepID=UPI0034E48D53